MGVHLIYYGQGKLENEMEKALERQKASIGILFTRIK